MILRLGHESCGIAYILFKKILYGGNFQINIHQGRFIAFFICLVILYPYSSKTYCCKIINKLFKYSVRKKELLGVNFVMAELRENHLNDPKYFKQRG